MIIENLQKENKNLKEIVNNHAKCFEHIREEKRKFYLLFKKEENEFERKYIEEKNKRYQEFYLKKHKQ